MTDIERAAQSSAMLNGTTPRVGSRQTRYGEGLQTQYLADPTKLYAQTTAPLASNVYEAQMQGVSNTGNWYDWRKVLIRVSPAASAATGETMPDDWQKVHIIKPVTIDTIPVGAYLTFAGSTWIVYKGRNMGSVLGDGIIRRCNSVINTLDWYGNIVTVPMSYAKMGTLGNASHATENSIVSKNYISCVCQLNPVSAQFRENTRLILGNAAYAMRGLNDFTREFTDDFASVHMLTFTIERCEPLPQDRIDLQCADYDSFRWDAQIYGKATMGLLERQTLEVVSLCNGEIVEDTEEHPVSYTFKSSNMFITVGRETGEVRALRAGSATITATLDQNPSVTATWTVTVTNSPPNKVEFTTDVPATLREFESVTIGARKADAPAAAINFFFSGPPETCYGVEYLTGNGVTITCYAASSVPLTVKAAPSGSTPYAAATAEIRLTAGN